MLNIEGRLEQFRDFLERAKLRTKRLAKSKIFLTSTSIVLAALLIFLIIPIFFDNSALKFQIKQKAAEILNVNLEIKGKVEIKFLPTPTIVINQALIENFKPENQNLDTAKVYNIYAEKIIIKLPIFPNQIGISAIIFENAILESYFDNEISKIRNNKLHEKFVALKSGRQDDSIKVGKGISAKLFDLTKIKKLAKPRKLPKLEIKNGEIIFYDFFARKNEIANLNLELSIKQKKIAANGSFVSQNIFSEFDFLAKFNKKSGQNSSYFNLKSGIANLEIEGDFLGENKIMNGEILANNFVGKAKLEIAELKEFYRAYLNSNDFFAKNLKENARAISISSNLKLENEEFEIADLIINSNLFDGKGGAIIGKKTNKILAIDLIINLENLDLDNLLQKQENLPNNQINENLHIQETPKIEEKEKTLNLSNARAIDLSSEINIKNIKYLGGEIKDMNLYLESAEGKNLLIMPLTFKIPGQGFIRINGVLDNSLNNTKFVGKIDGFGENLGEFFKFVEFYPQNLKIDNLGKYTIYSNILLTTKSADFHNLYLNLQKDNSEFLGHLKVNNSYKKLGFIGDFRVNSFNVDEYFFTSNRNSYLSIGSLLKKLLWLNNIRASGAFNLNFDKLIYKEEVFNNQNTQINFDAGFFEIPKISLNSENIKLTASLLADIRTNNPKFNLQIAGDKFYHQTQQLETFTEKQTGNKRDIFDQIYELPSLEDFSGLINIRIADLKLDEMKLDNFDFSGNLQQGIINNTKISLQIFDGNLDYKGMLGIKLQKTLNGSIILNNANLGEFTKRFFKLNNIDGVANIAASITSVANNKENFLNNLSLSIRINANAPSITGFGINELVRKMFLIKTYQRELQNPELILFNENSKSTFKQARASLEMTSGNIAKFRIDLSAPAINGVLSGSFDFKKYALDSTFNAIFITGNAKKQVPINIISNIVGSNSEFLHSANLDQVKQYLGIKDKVKSPALLPSQEKQSSTEDDNFAIEKTLLLPKKQTKVIEETQPQMFQVPLQ